MRATIPRGLGLGTWVTPHDPFGVLRGRAPRPYVSSMRRSLRCLIAVVALTAATFVVAAPAGAGDSSTSSPKQFAKGVCSAIGDWVDSIDATIDDLKNADSIEQAGDTATSGIEQATEQLESDLDSIDRPSTKDAKKAEQDLQQLDKQLQNVADEIEQELANPPSEPSDIASTFADIGSQMQKAASSVKSTANDLKGLAPDGELVKAFERAPACKQLKRSL
jgi:hypothetical protein